MDWKDIASGAGVLTCILAIVGAYTKLISDYSSMRSLLKATNETLFDLKEILSTYGSKIGKLETNSSNAEIKILELKEQVIDVSKLTMELNSRLTTLEAKHSEHHKRRDED